MVNQTIESLFTELCKKHDLTAISVHINLECSETHMWHSFMHWDGGVGYAYGANAGKALSNTLADVAARRGADITVPSDIEVGVPE